jgi:integrase
LQTLREAAALPSLRFHDLRHTVVTDLLEAGEPEHVVEAITGHLSRRMLEHYSHQRLKAKGQMLARMEERRNRQRAG